RPRQPRDAAVLRAPEVNLGPGTPRKWSWAGRPRGPAAGAARPAMVRGVASGPGPAAVAERPARSPRAGVRDRIRPAHPWPGPAARPAPHRSHGRPGTDRAAGPRGRPR